MNKLLYNVLPAVLLIALFGCEKPVTGEDEQGDKTPVLETVSVSVGQKTLTATTVVFECNFDLGEAVSMPLEAYFRYSSTEAMNGGDVKVVKLKAGAQDLKLTGLVFGKTYYYETFVEMFGAEYNKVKNSFSTQNITIEMKQAEQNANVVSLGGTLKGCGADDVAELELSLIVAEPDGYEMVYPVDVAGDGSFRKEITDLDLASEYMYKAVLNQGNLNSVESSVCSVSTLDPYKDAVKAFTTATDLAVSGTANCYIIAAPGSYKFPTVKGNTSAQVGNVASVRIFWESFGTATAPSAKELVSATGYADGYAYVEVPASYKEGNAVVAAYDSSDKILWSWHLWLTNDVIDEISYANEAGVMMDRNLGAVSDEANSVGAIGLYYQWGRKDPFLGAASIVDPVYAVATRRLKVTLNTDETSNVDYAVANPHKFILGNAGGDWLASKDNSLWTSVKTMYDPCPAGWRVPDGGYNGGVGVSAMADGIWAKAGFTRQGLTPFAEGDSGKIGKIFSTPFCSAPTWYPAAGSIENKGGTLYEVGVDGIYHSVSAFGGTDTHVTGLIFNYLPSLGGHYIYCGGEKFARAGGYSVRCCKE